MPAFLTKADRSEAPVLYITSRRFTERTNALTNIKVYSNARTAELFVNGASQGTRDNDGDSIFIWKDVKLSAGQNHIEARAQRNGQMLEDSCLWTLAGK